MLSEHRSPLWIMRAMALDSTDETGSNFFHLRQKIILNVIAIEPLHINISVDVQRAVN